jgi:putative transposase
MTTPTYRRARHSVSFLNGHLVFVTRYRRPVFTDTMLTFTEYTVRGVRGVRAELEAELIEFNGETDHVQVHLLICYPPTVANSALLQRLKGRAAYAVRREYSAVCVRARMRGHLWSPSHFAVSCGGAPLSIIRQYIDGQARPL